MGKTIWREVTIAYTFWLLLVLVMNTLMHGFVGLVLPLSALATIWTVNVLAWLWTNRS